MVETNHICPPKAHSKDGTNILKRNTEPNKGINTSCPQTKPNTMHLSALQAHKGYKLS